MIAALLLLLPRTQAKIPAEITPPATNQFTAYTPAAFSYYHSQREFSSITKVGTVISGVGIVTGVIGGVVIISALSQYNINDSKLLAGLVMFIGGGAAGITGGCLAVAGMHRQHRGRYGFNMVSPKGNQLGVAYNF